MFGFQKHSPKARTSRVRFDLEHLEAREVMSSSAVSNLGGTLIQFQMDDVGRLSETTRSFQADLGIVQGLYQGKDSAGHQIAIERVNNSVNEFTPDHGWISLGTTTQTAQDHSGNVYFKDGPDVFRATGVPTGGAAGRQFVDHGLQGLYQARDSAGNPAAYMLQDGYVYQIASSHWPVVSGNDVRQLEVDGNGHLFALSLNGICYRYPGSGNVWQAISGNDLRQLAVDGRGTLFGLSTSGTAFRYSGGGSSWSAVSGTDLRQLAVDGHGTLFGLNVDGIVYRYPGSGSSWQKVSGNDVSQLVVTGSGDMFALSVNAIVYRYPGSGSTWQPVSGNNVWQLVVDGRGELFGLSSNGAACHYAGGTNWQPISGRDLRQLAVDGKGTLFGLSQSGVVYSYPGTGNTWQAVSGNDVWKLVVDGRGRLFALTASKTLYEYPGAGSVWQAVSGHDLSDVLVDGHGMLFGLSVNHIAYRYSGSGSSWQAVSGNDLTQLTVDGRGVVYGLNVNNILYRYPGSGTAWQAIDNLVQSISTDATGHLQIDYTPIGQKWHQLGGASGSLGNLNGNEHDHGNGIHHADFQHGVIYWSAETGAHFIMGDPNDPTTLWGMFAQVGYEHTLGLPTSDGTSWIVFQKGSMSLSTGGKVSVFYSVDHKDSQVAEWDCGASSSARLLRWYGWDVSGGFMRSTVRASGDLQTTLGIMGATPQQYASAMQAWMPGMKVEDNRSGITFQRVLDLLAQGRPMIALLRVGEKEAVDGGNAGSGAVIGGILGGPAGAVIGGAIGAANQTYKIPLLHYVLINQVNYDTGRIGYIDPEGAVQQSMSFSEFQGAWNWTAGGLAGTILKNNDVHAGTIIHA